MTLEETVNAISEWATSHAYCAIRRLIHGGTKTDSYKQKLQFYITNIQKRKSYE